MRRPSEQEALLPSQLLIRLCRRSQHFLGALLVLGGVSDFPISVGAASPPRNRRLRRDLQGASSSPVEIVDATSAVVPSTEASFDHASIINDNLAFHWNDISGEQFTGRLVHHADSIDQAPNWLGMGVYHSNHNYTELPIDNFMVGSSAMVGLVSQAEAESAANFYRLGGKTVDSVLEESMTSGGVMDAVIKQHDRDDGSVVTILTFTKAVTGEGSNISPLRKAGVNVFLWAVGTPGGTLGTLGWHSLRGVIYLDFQAVQLEVEAATGLGGVTTTAGHAEGTPAAVTPPMTKPENDTRPNIAPLVSGQCSSTVLGGGEGVGQVALTPTSTFHYHLVGGNKIRLALEHTSSREVWLGLASSTRGYMVGSSAVIGSPGADGQAINPPKSYSLMDQDSSGLHESSVVTLEDATVVSVENSSGEVVTTLQFTKSLDDPNDAVAIVAGGGATTFLYAVGESRALAYHQHRGHFRIDLTQCGQNITATSDGDTSTPPTVVWTTHGLFAMHGFFAAIAWALLSPFAVTVAWFRTLVPSSWIYIHVFSHCFSFLLTVVAFFLAVGGVARQDGADHYTKTHHWTGTLLLCVSAFQVMNGFLRPPVERKDPTRNLSPQEIFLGILPIPRTPREAWHSIHRISGLAAIAIGVYQLQSGLTLYAQRFQTTSMVSYYWMYVGIFVISLVVLKLYVIREEDKARQGVLQAVSTSEPSTTEDEPQAETVGTMS
jgi:Eukaryotic cytochrome b561